jgi:hypothetical protein
MAISAPIAIPTEQIGSIPGPVNLIERIATGESKDPNLAPLCEDAVLNTFERAETIGSPVVTNGAHRKHHHSATYAMHGIPGTAPAGFKVPFSDHHARGVLRLTRGPLRYKRYVNCGFSPLSEGGRVCRARISRRILSEVTSDREGRWKQATGAGGSAECKQYSGRTSVRRAAKRGVPGGSAKTQSYG